MSYSLVRGPSSIFEKFPWASVKCVFHVYSSTIISSASSSKRSTYSCIRYTWWMRSVTCLLGTNPFCYLDIAASTANRIVVSILFFVITVEYSFSITVLVWFRLLVCNSLFLLGLFLYISTMSPCLIVSVRHPEAQQSFIASCSGYVIISSNNL